MGFSIEGIELLLLIAAIVGMLARRLRLPYTVGLVFAGLGLALLRVGTSISLTERLIFTAFLPPLVFEAAYCIPWKGLRRDMPVIAVLATLGVALSATLSAVGMRQFAHWPWTAALLFGSLIAATDPVSVLAIFKELRLHGRLRLLVEAESLLNDGTAAVTFTIALGVATGASMSAWSVVVKSVTVVLGGVICGGIVAGLALLLAGRTSDHLIEITFTTVAAYGSFLVAEHFGVSGVLAVLTAGVLVGNVGPLGAISERGRDAVASFWEYFAFVVNSLVFLLIGMKEARLGLPGVWPEVVIAVALVLAGRALAVYPCCAMFMKGELAVRMRDQHVLFWGGLRGALALALALGLPEQMPRRGDIVAVAFAVVAFSVIVQGLTMGPFLRWVGVRRSE